MGIHIYIAILREESLYSRSQISTIRQLHRHKFVCEFWISRVIFRKVWDTCRCEIKTTFRKIGKLETYWRFRKISKNIFGQKHSSCTAIRILTWPTTLALCAAVVSIRGEATTRPVSRSFAESASLWEGISPVTFPVHVICLVRRLSPLSPVLQL